MDELEGLIKISAQDEIDMWHDYKKHPTDVKKWQALYGSFKPVIMSAVQKNMYGSNIPASVHFAHAVSSFDNALKTYDPKAGAKLSSWIHTNVQEKGKRVNAKYGNIGFIPEARYFKITTFENAVSHLSDKLTREPSATELSDHLGWPIKQVESMRKELRQDLIEDETLRGERAILPDTLKSAVEYAYYEITPQQQIVYEYMFGTHGKAKTDDSKEISKKSGIPEPQVRQLKSKILQKVKSLM